MIGFFWVATALAQEAPPIVNGTETDDYLEVGALASYANNGSGYNFCSGTLVNERWVITAAHCVEAIDDNERWGYGNHYFILGSSVYRESDIIDFAEIVDWHTHPDYNTNNLAYDIGIIEPGSAVTAADPMPVNDDRPDESWGDITYVGFGITGDNQNDSGTKRTVDIPIAYVSSTHVMTYDSNTNICSGDSGGAALGIEDGKYELIGANSYIFNINGGQPTCDGSGGAGASTRVDNSLDWLEDFAELLRVEDVESGGSGDGGSGDGGSGDGGSGDGGSGDGGSDDGGSDDGGSGDGSSGDGGVDNDTGDLGGGGGNQGAAPLTNPARPSEVGLKVRSCSSSPSGVGAWSLLALAALVGRRRERTSGHRS